MLFPAWAGVIPVISTVRAYPTTFPRMGGGDPTQRYQKDIMPIFSPHGRG